jgi:hypothetical protein
MAGSGDGNWDRRGPEGGIELVGGGAAWGEKGMKAALSEVGRKILA